MPAMFWTALAAGVLLKGPLIIMVVGLAALTLGYRRSLRALAACSSSPLAGIVWFAILVLPWFVAIIGRTARRILGRIGWARICFSKVFAAQETHGAPPGYYFVLFWLTFWPGADARGVGGARSLGDAAPAGDQVSAGLAGAFLAPVGGWW